MVTLSVVITVMCKFQLLTHPKLYTFVNFYINEFLSYTSYMKSFISTISALNLHWRTPTTHRMSKWVKKVFLIWLPKLLFMRRPLDVNEESFRQVKHNKTSAREQIMINYHEHRVSRDLTRTLANAPIDERIQKLYYSPPVVKAFENICFIAELLKKKDRDDKVDEDWKFVAMVFDRLFLIIFSVACFVSTLWILLQAPTLFDDREAIDLQYRPTNISHISPPVV